MRNEPPFPAAPASPAAAEAPDRYPFTPVPFQRARRAGWTPERQRQFIAALARLGCVAQAAAAVGISARSAHKLRERPGAESFAAAWDAALEDGLDERRAALFERATMGTVAPRYRNGRVVGLVHSFDLRSAIAILSARGVDLEARRVEAARRRSYRQALKDAEERRLNPSRPAAAAPEQAQAPQEDEKARMQRLEALAWREARKRAAALREDREAGLVSFEEGLRREEEQAAMYEADRRRRGLPPRDLE
jgi:hypothetical protein